MAGCAPDRKNVELAVVIYDGCFSGSFINALEPPAGRRRCLITSSAADSKAGFGVSGARFFSTCFWQAIQNAGTGLGAAFQHAESQVLVVQAPQIYFYGQRAMQGAKPMQPRTRSSFSPAATTTSSIRPLTGC